MSPRSAFVLLALLATVFNTSARGQEAPAEYRSPKKAFGLSLLVPGLGHRYVHGGDWDGAASVHALADAGLWLGLLGSEVRRGQITSNYETYAAAHANAQIEGKDRQFYLNLASYRSSDEFLEVSLRNRAWDQVDYVSDRANQWRWETEADFARFRGMREDAESLRRRRAFLVGLLVANRVFSGFSALRAAGRVNGPDVSLSFSPAPGQRLPLAHLRLQF